jgi:hypothetical protein
MFRRILLSAIVISCVIAIGGGRASAQEIDKSGIPCPTGGCQQAVHQGHGKHRKARKAKPSSEASDDHSCGIQPCPPAQDPDKVPIGAPDTPTPGDEPDMY